MEDFDSVYKTAFDRLDRLYEDDELVQRIIPIYENDDNLYKRRQSTSYVYLWYKSGSKEVVDLFGNNVLFQRQVLEHLHQELIDETEKGKEQQDAVRQIIYTICHSNKDFRELLFSSDKEELETLCKDESKDKGDYESFIAKHPRTYPEYLFRAKYFIAKLTQTPFAELQEAKAQYGDCEWVKKIECKQTDSGIIYMITNESGLSDNEKKLLVLFLEDFARMVVGSSNDINRSRHILVANRVVTERIWNIVMKTTPVLFCAKNGQHPRFIRYDEVADFINGLQKMLCVRFRILSVSERNMMKFDKQKDTEKYYNAKEWCASEDKNSERAPVYCEFQQNEDNNGKKIHYILKSKYAACRLVVDV